MSSLAWFRDQIGQVLPEVPLSDQQFSLLFGHFELLNRWNERMDLTSVDTPAEIVSRHYCESLFFAQHLPADEADLAIVDFGSGAGFPGFPMAVLHPEWHITLLEANQRRAVFLKEAARTLQNVSVVAQRGEEFAQKHDWVVARAVKSKDVLECVPRLADGVALLVSEAIIPELNKVKGFRWSGPVAIPGSQARCCVFGRCST